jgi:hypothetical protein
MTMTSTGEGRERLAKLKRERAATFERLAREWSNPAHGGVSEASGGAARRGEGDRELGASSQS